MATELDTQRGVVRVPTGTWTIAPAHSSVEFRIKRRQQALETGGLLVGDEVRVVADIAAVCSSPDAAGAAE